MQIITLIIRFVIVKLTLYLQGTQLIGWQLPEESPWHCENSLSGVCLLLGLHMRSTMSDKPKQTVKCGIN